MMPQVAIGPRSAFASWDWVGHDLAQALLPRFAVCTFENGCIPAARVVLFIKDVPSAAQLGMVHAVGSRIIYVPIDYFRNERHIRRHAAFLSACNLVVVHSPALVPYFLPYARVQTVDHHSKYCLATCATFKESGYALWIGVLQNLPYLLHYLERHVPAIEIKILTNARNASALVNARTVARRLRIKFRWDGEAVNGYALYPWSEATQALMMNDAKAAIDIKGEAFNQRMKPPTKAQKFLCSGLPLAMNSGPISDYIARHGLDIPQPSDGRWLSREYYDQVCVFARRLAPSLTLEHVAAKFAGFIEEVFSVEPREIGPLGRGAFEM